jgi:hypothetical protein
VLQPIIGSSTSKTSTIDRREDIGLLTANSPDS